MRVALCHDVIEGPPGSDTVLLLGSLGSDRSMWTPQIAALGLIATVVAVDAWGHGGSPVPATSHTIDELGEDVCSLLDELLVERAHVVGLSLGGAVAQWLAVHRPERVDTLSLLCTAAQFDGPANWTARADAVRRDGVASIADSVIARWFTPGMAQREQLLVSYAKQMFCGVSDGGYAACCEALSQWDSRSVLNLITAPTLLIAGAEDLATPPSVMSILAAGISDARLTILTPAAHLVNLEQSQIVSQMLVEHIQGVGESQVATEHLSVLEPSVCDTTRGNVDTRTTTVSSPGVAKLRRCDIHVPSE